MVGSGHRRALPGKGPKALEASGKRFIDGRTSGTLAVECWAPGAFKRRLNQSGWFEDEVIVAGWLEQGERTRCSHC